MNLLTFIKQADIFDIAKIELHLGLEIGTIQKLIVTDEYPENLTIEKLYWFFKSIGISGPWNSSINPCTKLMDCLPGEKEIPA
jgi:hypothetical protein